LTTEGRVEAKTMPKDRKPLTIALIEDEPLVRVPLAKGLGDAGFQVVSGANGVEGLVVLENPDIDIAVIDVRLPGRIDGIALAREALRQRPGLKIIFTSAGKPAAELMELGLYLEKPFGVAELMVVIRQLTDAPTG
jgi:DNA-binding response OmpR family regulator